jgi:hypothetical protein
MRACCVRWECLGISQNFPTIADSLRRSCGQRGPERVRSLQRECTQGRRLRFRSTFIRFLNLCGILTAGFPPGTAEKRLGLQSLKGQMKAEDLGTPSPELSSFVWPGRAVSRRSWCVENSGPERAPRAHKQTRRRGLNFIYFLHSL